MKKSKQRRALAEINVLKIFAMESSNKIGEWGIQSYWILTMCVLSERLIFGELNDYNLENYFIEKKSVRESLLKKWAGNQQGVREIRE